MFFRISVFESFVPVRAMWWWGNGEREGLLIYFLAVQTPEFPVIDSQA